MLESNTSKTVAFRSTPAARYVSVCLAVLALAGCASGPDFTKPELPVQQATFLRSEASSATQPVAADPAFWTQFDDPTLNQLVKKSISGNLDLAIALARLQSAEAVLDKVRFDRFPTVTMGAGASQQKLAERQLTPGEPRSTRTYNASIRASWEVDVFGRVRRAIEAQSAEAEAAAQDLRALQLLIASQVVSSYTELRSIQWRLKLARANEKNQRKTVELVQWRVTGGIATPFDSSRAIAQWQSTQSRIPQLEAQMAVVQHRLAVLAGASPQALLSEFASLNREDEALPSIPGRLNLGVPADVLRRRPDVQAAEARLHSATARIGVATADLFPRASLQGLIGGWALGGSNLLSGSAATSSVVLGIDWSFLDVGRVRARISASEAGAALSLSEYQKAVLSAVEETENALVNLDRRREEFTLLSSAAAESSKAEQQARWMYRSGTIALLDVLEVQRAQLVAEDAKIQSQAAALQATVNLYKSVAGGWSATDTALLHERMSAQ